MPFSPLLQASAGGKDGFVPLHVDEREAPVDDGSGFTPGFKPLVAGRMGAEYVTPSKDVSGAGASVGLESEPTSESGSLAESSDGPLAGSSDGPLAGSSDGPLAGSSDDPIQESSDAPIEEVDTVDVMAEGEAEDLEAALLKVREEAFALGLAEGREAARNEMDGKIARLESLANELDSVRREVFERCVSDVATAVTHIAQNVVQRELLVDSTGVEALIIDVLDHVQAQDELVIRVAPEDERLMQNALPKLMERLGRDSNFRIQSDSELHPGGARIETLMGSIDASVETRFAAFADTVDAWATEEASDEPR